MLFLIKEITYPKITVFMTGVHEFKSGWNHGSDLEPNFCGDYYVLICNSVKSLARNTTAHCDCWISEMAKYCVVYVKPYFAADT
jgi:hypothetical protein